MPPPLAMLENARRLMKAGKLDQAAQVSAALLSAHPHFAEGVELSGVLALQRRDYVAAESAFARLAALRPTSHETHHRHSIALHQIGEHTRAAGAARRATSLRPDFAPAWTQLGLALGMLGERDHAVVAHRRATELAPAQPQGWVNLGSELLAAEKPSDALSAFRRAHALAPDHPLVLAGLGAATHQAGGLGDAITLLEAAHKAHPTSPEITGNLGKALVEAGEAKRGCALLEHALTLQPGSLARRQVAVTGLNYGTEDIARIKAAHAAYSARFTDGIPPLPPPDAGACPRDPERRLRVGFMSADLREHSCKYFLEPLLAGLDRAHFEVWGVPTLDNADAVTGQLRLLCDGWLSLFGLENPAAARAIRDAGIDVLIECSGHTAGHRLGVCALRPAPLQMTFLGYPATTGLDRIDYRLVDAITDPPGTETHCVEKLLRVPGCLWCFRPSPDAPPPAPPPFETAGHVTLGSFNMFTKISPGVVRAWAAILRELPDAKLLLKNKWLHDAGTMAWFRAKFEALGVAPARISAVPFAPTTADHLGAYALIDFQLDTFPYNGTTTTCESFWQGVPVVAMNGSVHAARVSQCLLAQVGLEDLLGDDEAGYIQKAVSLARDTRRLATIRRTLRDRMASSPLRDEAGYARRFGGVIRDAWRAWCAGHA